MTEKGQIVELNNDLATVKILRKEACSKCGICKNGESENEMLIEAKNLSQANIGDFVEVSLQTPIFFKALFIMYGIPLVSLILGFIVGYISLKYTSYKSYNEIVSFIVGIVFMLFSYMWIKYKEPSWKEQNILPMIIRKYNV